MRPSRIEALCSEVTILAAGRVVFSGPLTKLAAENSELDYRVVTSDPAAARRVRSLAPHPMGSLPGDPILKRR